MLNPVVILILTIHRTNISLSHILLAYSLKRNSGPGSPFVYHARTLSRHFVNKFLSARLSFALFTKRRLFKMILSPEENDETSDD